MKKHIPILLAVAVASTVVLVAPPPAEAHVSWSVGTNFSVGGLHFDLVFGNRGHYGRHAADFYYRSRRPMSYRGLSCHGGCFRDRGFTYHHPDCGVVGAHFHRHRFSPFGLVQLLPPPLRYQYHDHFSYRAPRSYRHGPYGHGDYDRYRYDGYRGRQDDRYRSHRYSPDHRDREHRYDQRDRRPRERRHAVPRRGHGGRHDDWDSDSDH